MAWQQNQGFTMPMYKDFVPEKLRFWITLFFPLVFQMSDALFMGLSGPISASTSLTSNDVLFCGFCGMIGVTVTFPVLFRFKFRFTTRQILLIVSLGMVLCNLICLNTTFMPVLALTNFIFGILKLWGSFECFSSIMMKVSPRYNFAPFLAIVFTVVFGGIELSGILANHLVYGLPWQYMNYIMMGLQLLVALLVVILMRDIRLMPLNRLYGISWIGMFLWGIVLAAFTFIFVYGDQIDWFHSPYTHIAIGVMAVALSVLVYRMFHYRHPYLEYPAFRYRNLWNILMLFFLAALIMSTESVLHHIFTEEVLHYGSLSIANLKWWVVAGILFGGFVSVQAIDHWHWSYKLLTSISIGSITLYVMLMTLAISPQTPIHLFYLPMFLYGVGHVMIFIVLTTYVEGIVPLQHRFQVLTILGFVRIGPGSAVGSALCGHLFKAEMSRSLVALGSQVNTVSFRNHDFGTIANEVVENAMMLSLRNLYGLMTFIGLITLIILLASRYQPQIKNTLPTLGKAFKVFSRK